MKHYESSSRLESRMTHYNLLSRLESESNLAAVMMYSGICFMIAAVILAAAEHISMIVIGRVLQGIAISFASVSVPIYNSGRCSRMFAL